MGIFAGLTPELPSVIVDRVHLKITTLGDADFLAFFADAGGTSGANIRILQRPDPVSEPSDPRPALLLWGLSQDSGFEVGGGRFQFGVGWRIVYDEADRFRGTGDADAGSLVWKLVRVLWNNQSLLNAVSQDPKTDKIDSFRAVVFQGLELQSGGCIDVIEGEVVYSRILDKGEI